ncbi:MAG: alanine racemase [Psychromonas sp.]|nr:alanine racemase [Psychromonas sp.]
MNFVRALINLKALKHNLSVLQAAAPKSKILAVIKGNAYGHGMVEVAQTLDNIYGLGVARINEAIMLRTRGITKDILLLEGFINPLDLSVLVFYNLQTVIHCSEQVDFLFKATLIKPLKIWLKLDIGMHRLGFRPEEFHAVLKRLIDCPNVEKPINILGHFNCADELENPITHQQITLFKKYISEDIGSVSLANSAGILAWPDSHLDIIRPGVALYGVSPFVGKTDKCQQLKPVMTLKSKLIAVRHHLKGESVGYGADWVAQSDCKVGVVAMGYGDGYPRMAPQGTPILINSRIVSLIGRVSMDMLTVDLGLNCTDKVGDDAILWGDGLSVNDVAKHIGTIGYELMTKLTPRVDLQYHD